jgi:hypothetical protein
MIHPVRACGVVWTVAREEVWLLGPERERREERLSHGRAEFSDEEMAATDEPDPELLEATASALERSRSILPVSGTAAVARIAISARRATNGAVAIDSALVFSIGALSVVSTIDSAASDFRLLAGIAGRAPSLELDYREAPLVWRGGSGAVLMHEAAGHPAEHHRGAVAWPEWLTVHDEPASEFDDLGRATRAADLLAGEAPLTARRASFADVALQRLSNVIVRQRRAPFDLPRRRIEVLLVGSGAYDPLSDSVHLTIAAADLVDGRSVQRLPPFTIAEPRPSIAFAMRGAAGEPERYPGVVCSSEGQEIVVGSHAPLLLTEF